MANMDNLTTDEFPASPGLACPACHGVLFELPGEPSPRFRCRVGHAWSPSSLLDEQADAFEGALWMALRSLEEKAALSRRMAEAATERGNRHAADRYRSLAADADEAGQLIRTLITRLDNLGDRRPDLERVE